MNPPPLFRKSQLRVLRSSLTNGTTSKESNDGSLVVHMLSYYEEVQTHPLNLFQYAFLKYFLRCQFIKNISDPAQVITQ